MLEVYRFSLDAERVPWGGALWIPGIQWNREEASALVRELLAWLVWIDRQQAGNLRNQVINNLRSWQLANTFNLDGRTQPSWRTAQSTADWLMVYGRALGEETIREILEQQGVSEQKPYRETLEQLAR